MPTHVQFDGHANVLKSPPDSARWVAAPSGVASQGLKASNPALVLSDSHGRYLGPGLPLLGIGDLVPAGITTRIEASLDFGIKQPMCRIILPLSDLLAGGAKVSNPGVDVLSQDDVQYLYVEAKASSQDIVLSAYLTDPFATIGSGSLSGALLARERLKGAAASGGLFVAEAGPRFVRAWWMTTTKFSRRAPDLGCAVPWMDMDRWGILCQDAKIRAVTMTSPIENADGDDYAIIGVPDEEPAPDDSAPQSTRDYSRPVDLRYVAPPHVRRRRACLMLRTEGPGGTGRLADNFYRRLDAERTLIYVPNGEVQLLTVSSLGEYLSGDASDPLQIATTADAADGPGAGIGSGRSNLDDGGELAMNLPIAKDAGAEFVYRQQTTVADQGGDRSIQQSSSKPGHEWKFSVNIQPKHLRRVERAACMAGGARSFWMFPPLGPRQIPVFTRAVSHEIRGPKRAELQMDVEES